MEQAGRLLTKARLAATEAAGVQIYHLTPRAWPKAVGKTVARHSRPVFLAGGKLTVEVDDEIWRAQLSGLAADILGQLDSVLGKNLVRQIEFRVAPPRRPMASALPVASASTDEADRIEDPVMRRLYIAARRKASA